jgi:hypothetical protein
MFLQIDRPPVSLRFISLHNPPNYSSELSGTLTLKQQNNNEGDDQQSADCKYSSN